MKFFLPRSFLAIRIVAASLFILALFVWLSFWPYMVRGVVTGASGPVAGARVRLRATDIWTTTDASGVFALPMRGFALHRTVTAWKDGYYTGAADLTGFGGHLRIALRPLALQDHPEMPWLPSDADPKVELACANCHVELHRQWRRSGHANAASNKFVLMFYNGVDAQGTADVGQGYRLDFPDQVGNCASCHAPGAAVDHPAGVDLNDVAGEATNGVFCQFCHAIDFAHSPYAETTTGVNALKLLRPPTGQHLFIGPFDDAPGRDTFNPIYRQSEACASCHNGGWWNVPAYATYDEWQKSPYAAEGVQCQDCHMAPNGQSTRSVSPCAPQSTPFAASLPIAVGEFVCRAQACVACHATGRALEDADPTSAAALLPARHPDALSTHGMSTEEKELFLRNAVALRVNATQDKSGVLATVVITNAGAGHHLPTGSPLRNMILLVTATDSTGRSLSYAGDEVIPAWAGVGSVEQGNYAGLPGKGYAKIMEDYDGNAPAPPWRNGIHILNDNRIPARGSDQSQYRFVLASAEQADQGPISVSAKLIYRRAFKLWNDEKNVQLPDTVIAETIVAATPGAGRVASVVSRDADHALFAPSLATTFDGKRLDHAKLATPEQCGACHTAAASAWQASGHALAAISPLYRARVKVAMQDTHLNAGPFCAGCHTPLGLLSGQIRTRWTWAGQEEHPLDAVAQTGVSCSVCHSITAVTDTGNGSFVIDPTVMPLPDKEGHPPAAKDEQPLLREASFCATCHEAADPTSGLPVMTTYSEWRASRFNTDGGAPGEISVTTCQDCHFADGRHGALRPEDLANAAEIAILTPVRKREGALAFTVQVTNTGAGHDLPTGATELRQVWLAVTVTDATGKLLFRSGEVNEYGDPVAGSVTYGTVWLDAEGKPTERLWEAVGVLYDRRIPAGAAVTETFQFDLPADVAGPLRVRAALNYRAVSGYLGSLMSIYGKEAIQPAPAVEMATTEAQVALP